MLNKNKRLLMATGAVVGTAGLVTAIAVPLALRNKEDGAAVGKVVYITGSTDSKVLEVATKAKELVAVADSALANANIVSVQEAGNKIVITGTPHVRRKRAAATVVAFTLTITMDGDKTSVSLTKNMSAGSPVTVDVTINKQVTDKLEDLHTAFVAAPNTPPVAAAPDATPDPAPQPPQVPAGPAVG